jgi:hypothetical protein
MKKQKPKTIVVSGDLRKRCPTCHGAGFVLESRLVQEQKSEFRKRPYSGHPKCIYCKGWGHVLDDDPQADVKIKCTYCNGTGRDALGMKHKKISQDRRNVIAALIKSPNPLTFGELKCKTGLDDMTLLEHIRQLHKILFFDKRTKAYVLRKPIKDILGIL